MIYLIEDLFPAGQVHLVGGPSGAGKTRLMFQMYKALQTGNDFLGRRVRQTKWAYISGDRPERSVRETMEYMGVDFPVFSLVDRSLVGKDLLNVVIPQLTAFYCYKPDLIYIDGFTGMVPEGKFGDYTVVSQWLASLQRYCASKNVTILGACHTTKTKENETFKDPRQRIAGSVAWAGYSETVVVIDKIPEKGHENERIISFEPRNKPPEYFYMTFNEDGHLERMETPDNGEHEPSKADLTIPSVLDLKVGITLDYKACITAVGVLGYSRRTFDRWLSRQVEDGFMSHPKKGIYVVERLQREPEKSESFVPEDHHKKREEDSSKTVERREDAQIPQETRVNANEDKLSSPGRRRKVPGSKGNNSLPQGTQDSGQAANIYQPPHRGRKRRNK